MNRGMRFDLLELVFGALLDLGLGLALDRLRYVVERDLGEPLGVGNVSVSIGGNSTTRVAVWT